MNKQMIKDRYELIDLLSNYDNPGHESRPPGPPTCAPDLINHI